jgi:hypothetical protein
MLLALLLAAHLGAPDTLVVHNGRARELTVRIPRSEAEAVIDGRLDEPVWRQATILNGFSQFSPVDGIPAADSTEVRIWYSPTAIHFGIRAFEPHGEVHATLADRDRIFADDHITILLGTYNDGRQAMVFAVNPLGVQGDGALVETGNRGTNSSREPTDLSPDYVFQSKGHLTDFGYEVEVRVPFKSLRYQRGAEHNWGINVVRRVQHSGYEDSWAPATRANPSFLGQSGTLTGLTDLRRGVVVDVNPELTSRVSGTPDPAGRWIYDGGRPDVGGNVRWGITNNLTLNGTVNPDFSQVESDAGQLAFDPRQALFFAERRPFFLDGIEQFNTPNNLIYTRRIVQPVASAKLAGKAFGTNIALLSAVDDQAASASGSDNPVFNIFRLQRDVGRRSRIGMAYTDRVDGDGYNRVADIDGRIVFGGAYSANFQLAASRTRRNDVITTAPLWQFRLDNTGRHFGFRTLFSGIDEDFRAASGFIQRAGIVRANVNPRYTAFGRPGGLVESFTGDILLDGTWQYQKFVDGDGIQDKKLHFNGNAQLRGGWQVGTGLFVETFGYDEGLYSGYALQVPNGASTDTIPFTGQPTIPNIEPFLQVVTPQFKHFSGNFFVLYGNDENFFEWQSAHLLLLNLGVSFRPTDKLRADFTYNWQQVNRRTDGSRVNVGRIPRLKLEYQIARPLFVRLVGQYSMQQTDALRDNGRTEAPILIFDQQRGVYVLAEAEESNSFRADVLVSYRPTPGTVVFLGYGSSLNEPDAIRSPGLRRTDDAFFLKMSYLFRVN